MKSEVVDFWQAKLELEAMDDVLPITIYIVCMSELKQPQTILVMIEDYLRAVDGYDFERKLVCNYDCAIRYVCEEWELI